MKIQRILLMAGSCVAATPVVFATPAIDSNTLEGLPYVGSDVGTFLKNLAPGIGTFIVILGVFGGVAAIIYAIVGVIRNKVTV